MMAKNYTSDKRAQMEILGLAIVMLIIFLAMFFMTKILTAKKPSQARQDFVTEQLALNMVSTFFGTSARECSRLTMTELLQDCAKGVEIKCEDLASSDSCKYFELTAKEILDKTLVIWNAKYHFFAYVDESSLLVELGEKCTGEITSSKPQPVPLNPGQVYLRLDICR